MKNKLINKFAFMFVIGLSLLFTCSNAAEIFKDSTTLTLQQGLGAEEVRSDFDDLGHTYNHSQLNSFFLQHASYLRNDSTYTNPEFDLIVEDLMAKASSFHNYDYDGYLFTSTGDTNYHLFLFNSDDVDIAYYENGSGKYVYFSLLEGSNFLYFRRYNASTVDYMYCENVLSGYYMNRNYTRLAIQSNLSIKLLSDVTTPTTDREFTWDGTSYYQYIEDEPEGPNLSDDDVANVINIFLSSEDLAINRPAGYDDYYVIYNSLVDQYYIYLYKSSLNLAMRYGDFDDEGNFDFNDLSSGEGFKIFRHELDGDLNFIEDLWATICEYFSTSKYYLFRVNPIVNKCHFIDSYSDNALVYTGSMEHMVYTTKDITLLVGSGLSGTIVDTDNSITSGTLINSSTNEEYEFVMPETSVSDTPWNRFISTIQSIPEKIKSEISNMTGLTKIVTLISPIGSAILIILNVLLSSISLLARAVAFVYTLPTINASDSLFLVDVDSTTGLVFAGNSWGTKFLEGLNMVKEFSWNGLNLWTLFTSFIVAMFAIHCVKLVRKHYHY